MVEVGLAGHHPGALARVSPWALHYEARPETTRQGGVVGPILDTDDLPAWRWQPRTGGDVDEVELVLEAPACRHLCAVAADGDAADMAHRGIEALRRLEGHDRQRPYAPAKFDRRRMLHEVGRRTAPDLRGGDMLGEAEDFDAPVAQDVDRGGALEAQKDGFGEDRLQARGQPDVVRHQGG